jgi:hypothetical protein
MDAEEQQQVQPPKPAAKGKPVYKPHQHHKGEDFYAKHLQQNEEVDQQAPLLVVVQGPKKVPE